MNPEYQKLLTDIQTRLIKVEKVIKRTMDYTRDTNRDMMALKKALKKQGINVELDLKKDVGE